MVFSDPLSTESNTANGGPDSGTSPLVILLWLACIPLGLYCWLSLSPETMPQSVYAGEEPLTPTRIAEYRALPPDQQLFDIWVEPYATDATVSCRTLEPLKIQIRYAAPGKPEKVEEFAERRPERLHIHSLEGLSPDTEYRFQLTMIERESGVPRGSRTGRFHTLVTDEVAPPSPEPAPSRRPRPEGLRAPPSPGQPPPTRPPDAPVHVDEGPDEDEPGTSASPAPSGR